jgi:hypothetical protein
VATYTLSPESYKKLRNKMLREISSLAALAFIVILVTVCIIIRPVIFIKILFWPSFIISIIILCIGTFWIYRKIQSYSSYAVTLDSEKIHKGYNDSNETAIHRSFNKQIFNIDGQGICIVVSEPSLKIFIPIEIQDYERFILDLKAWSNIKIQSKLSAWRIIEAIFSMVWGLALLISIVGVFPKELKSVREIYLVLLWVTFVGFEFITEGAALSLFMNASRKENPWIFWTYIGVICIPFLWLSSFDLAGFLNLETSILVGNSLLVIVWISILVTLVVKSMRE